MSKFRYFGTDGIRGVVGKAPITADFILKLGWAIGMTMNASKSNASVMVGKDTRISGYMFESALQAGLVASGTNILLCGPLSTPAVAYLTQTFNAGAGIVISASHNSYHDNGIKIFSSHGTKVSDAFQEKVESYIDQPLHTVTAAKLGRASRVADAPGRYIEYCKGTLTKGLTLAGYTIVVDCAHGATYGTAPKVFEELGAEVITIGAKPNGFNINQKCGSTHPEQAAEAVRKHRADFGVVLDGDGDRLVMIDDTGEVLDGDDLLFILASHWHTNGKLQGGIVGTDMTNKGLEIYCKQQGIDFERVPVGDRNIVAALEKNAWSLGGETSGHLICPNYSTTGDGIVAALQIITVVAEQKKTLHTIKKGYTRSCQKIVNLSCADQQIMNDQAIQAIITKHQKSLGNDGRIFARSSGTEPLFRLLIESHNSQVVETVSAALKSDIEKRLEL